MIKAFEKLMRGYRILGIFGTLGAIRAKLSKKPILIKVPGQIAPNPIYLRVPSSDVEVFYQVFRSEEYKFEANASPGFIVDAGANIGLTSVFFAQQFPNARILAIEPESSNFEVLKKNVEGYQNIIPFHGALSVEDGDIELIDPGLGNWGFRTGERVDDSANLTAQRRTVPGITVNKIIEEYGVQGISILKLDIEGAELEILCNAAPWVDRVESLIAELHDHIKVGCTRAFYRTTDAFDNEWHQGELVCMTRTGGFLRKAV